LQFCMPRKRGTWGVYQSVQSLPSPPPPDPESDSESDVAFASLSEPESSDAFFFLGLSSPFWIMYSRREYTSRHDQIFPHNANWNEDIKGGIDWRGTVAASPRCLFSFKLCSNQIPNQATSEPQKPAVQLSTDYRYEPRTCPLSYFANTNSRFVTRTHQE
jgi:hypothetical protein